MKTIQLTTRKAMRVFLGVCLLAAMTSICSCGKDDDDVDEKGPKTEQPKEDEVIDDGMYYSDGPEEGTLLSCYFKGNKCYKIGFINNFSSVTSETDFTIKGDSMYQYNTTIYGLKVNDSRCYIKRIDDETIIVESNTYKKDLEFEELTALPNGPYTYTKTDRSAPLELFVDGGTIYFTNTVNQKDQTCTFYKGSTYDIKYNIIFFNNPTANNEFRGYLLKKDKQNFIIGNHTITASHYSEIPEGTYVNESDMYRQEWIIKKGYKASVNVTNLDTKESFSFDCHYFVYDKKLLYILLNLKYPDKSSSIHYTYKSSNSNSFIMEGDKYTKQ